MFLPRIDCFSPGSRSKRALQHTRDGRHSFCRLQFTDFIEAILPDTHDLDPTTFEATQELLIKRLRRRWIVRAEAFSASLVDLPVGTLSRVLGVHDNILSIGQGSCCVWGPATRSLTANRVGQLASSCSTVDILLIGGLSGAEFLNGLSLSAGEVALCPHTIRLTDNILDHRPAMPQLRSVRTVQIAGIACDVSQDLVPSLLQHLSDMPGLVDLRVDQVRVVSASVSSRRTLLSASTRKLTSDIWSQLSGLRNVKHLSMDVLEMDARCAAGLCRAIGDMAALKSLRLLDHTQDGILRLQYSRLRHLHALEVVTDDVEHLGDLSNLRSLTVTSMSAPQRFPDTLIKELACLQSLSKLDIRIPEQAWRWVGGLGDIPGLDELVLASHSDKRYPGHPVSGPTYAWLHAAVVPDAGKGDARLTAPKRSRPRTIAISKNCLGAIAKGVASRSHLVDTIMRSGVQQSVIFVGSTSGSSDTVAVNDLDEFVRRAVAAG